MKRAERAQRELAVEPDLEAGREYLRLLRRTLVRIRALTTDLIEPHGLTAQQFLALLTIRDHEGLTQRELSSELDSDPNTVSAMILRLSKKQLLRREQHEEDGRALRLYTTDQGRALVDTTQLSVDRLSLQLHALMPAPDAAVTAWLKAVIAIRDLPE